MVTLTFMAGPFRRSIPLALISSLLLAAPPVSARERPPEFAAFNVLTGIEDCQIELDSKALGSTDASGRFSARGVEAGDHYLHVACPGRRDEDILITVSAGETLEFDLAEPKAAPAEEDGLALAERQLQLRRHIREAVELRSRGRLEEAVRHLREARRLDPENADLHRELGITFLEAKDWKRARVEMLEAIRHSPEAAEAYNGLGYALEKLGDLQGAIAAYREAANLEPDHSSYRRQYLNAMAKWVAQQAEQKKK
jgi:tetratricopeptide (TPR) repeat protein